MHDIHLYTDGASFTETSGPVRRCAQPEHWSPGAAGLRSDGLNVSAITIEVTRRLSGIVGKDANGWLGERTCRRPSVFAPQKPAYDAALESQRVVGKRSFRPADLSPWSPLGDDRFRRGSALRLMWTPRSDFFRGRAGRALDGRIFYLACRSRIEDDLLNESSNGRSAPESR